jgi:hypothetical protein
MKESQSNETPQTAPSYEEFLHVVQDIIEEYKKKDLSRLRTPLMREIYEKAWIQKLRNYAVQRQLRDAFEALIRRFWERPEALREGPRVRKTLFNMIVKA